MNLEIQENKTFQQYEGSRNVLALTENIETV